MARGLEYESSVVHFLELRVQIPPNAWKFDSYECCVLSGRGSGSGWSPVQRTPTEYGMSECDREVSTLRRPWPTRGCCVMEKNSSTNRWDVSQNITSLGTDLKLHNHRAWRELQTYSYVVRTCNLMPSGFKFSSRRFRTWRLLIFWGPLLKSVNTPLRLVLCASLRNTD